MKKSETTLRTMIELPERIAAKVMLISALSGILAGMLARMFNVDYWVDMAFWTAAGVAFTGLMLDLIIFTVLAVIAACIIRKEEG